LNRCRYASIYKSFLMQIRTFSTPERYIFLTTGFTSVAISFLFIFMSARATILQRKALFQKKPRLESEAINYYKTILSYLSKASQLNGGNADYYRMKADYLMEAVREGFQNQLYIYMPDIEKLYIKAIRLNPAFFLYHARLGLFYSYENKPEAEETLLRAIRLCPRCYGLYAELANHYFLIKKEKEGFFALIEMIAMIPKSYLSDARPLLKIIGKSNAQRLEKVSFVYFAGKYLSDIIYAFDPQEEAGEGKILDFKKLKFPHVQVPLQFRIYTNNAPYQAVLYHKYTPLTDFVRRETASGYVVYEAKLDSYSSDVYLDDLRIEYAGEAIVDKVEIVIHILRFDVDAEGS